MGEGENDNRDGGLQGGIAALMEQAESLLRESREIDASLEPVLDGLRERVSARRVRLREAAQRLYGRVYGSGRP